MAIKLFELGFLLKGIDQLSGPLKTAMGQVEALKAATNTQSLGEFSTKLGMIGGAAMGMAAAIGLPIKAMIEESATVNESLQHLKTNLDSGTAGVREFAQAQQFAEQMSIKFDYAQTDVIDNLYRAKSFLGDWNEALAVTSASLAVAKGNMGDAATVGQQLSIIVNDFGDKTKSMNPQISRFADLMAYISRNGAFHDVNELSTALGESIGSAKTAGMSLSDVLATLNAFKSAGVASPGMALEESLQAFSHGKSQKDLGVALATVDVGNKKVLDVIGTLVNLRHELGAGAISVDKYKAATAALGIRGNQALTINVDDLVKMRDVLNSPVVNGAAMQGALTMLQAFNEQLGILGKKWDVFKEAGGNQLLAPLASIARVMGSVIMFAAGLAKAHPMVTKFLMVFAALSVALLVVVGGFALLVAGLTFIGSTLGVGAAAMFAWVIGISRIVAAAALIITYWTPIKKFFTEMIPEAFNWGLNLLKTFASGIEAAALYPVHAIEKVVGKIREYLPFSPAKLGPLRDLNRLRIVETIANTIRPGPVMGAMARVAGAVAIAAPMMIGAGVGGGRGGIIINYAPTINVAPGTDKDAFRAELKRHAKDLEDILAAQLARKNRGEF